MNKDEILDNLWVIYVSGYGEFFFVGTEKEAEEMRVHKCRWEQGIGRKFKVTPTVAIAGAMKLFNDKRLKGAGIG